MLEYLPFSLLPYTCQPDHLFCKQPHYIIIKYKHHQHHQQKDADLLGDFPGLDAQRPAENRVKEALALPGVQCLVVACPKDLIMFQDAVKTTGLEDKIVVKDLIELVGDALEVHQDEGVQ